jgi:hypothetical protein
MHRERIKCISSAKTFPETSLAQKPTKSMTSPATLQGFAWTSADACWLPLLEIFDDHHLGTSMPLGGHPPHQLAAFVGGLYRGGVTTESHSHANC